MKELHKMTRLELRHHMKNKQNKRSPVERRVMCEHLLGTYDSGLGSETVLIYDGEDRREDLIRGDGFYPFKYCARCGEKLSI